VAIESALKTRVKWAGSRVSRKSLSRLDRALSAAVLAAWTVLIPGLVPDRISDRGIFVSVAGRLLAGDTLYREVYDNKDPLFYYFVTLQLILGPWAEVAAEALLIASAAAAAYVLAASSASRFAAAAVSCIAVPIILTGAFYIPGYTELPGIVITLLAIAAAASERPLLAGLCLGALPFLKFAFLPVALAGIGPFLLLRLPFSALLRLALGSFLSMAGIASVLALRGELMPFLDTIKRNIAYAQGSLVGSKKGLAGISEHVRLVGVDRLLREVLPIALAVVLSATLLFRKWTSNQVALASAAACAATLLASLFVIFFAGFWSQHLQVLYIPAILAVIALALVFDSLAEGRRLRMLGLVFLAGFLLSGSPFPVQYAERIDSAYASYGALRELAPEARRLLALGTRTPWDAGSLSSSPRWGARRRG